MASCKLLVVFVFVGLAAFCNAAPADKQSDVEAVPIEGLSGPASPKDLKASSSYGLGYAYPSYGYGSPYAAYGYGSPYGYGYGYGLGAGYYGGYYPRYYYGGYHGYPYFG